MSASGPGTSSKPLPLTVSRTRHFLPVAGECSRWASVVSAFQKPELYSSIASLAASPMSKSIRQYTLW